MYVLIYNEVKYGFVSVCTSMHYVFATIIEQNVCSVIFMYAEKKANHNVETLHGQNVLILYCK